jgi:hypothetical protein
MPASLIFHNEEDYIKITNYTINCGHVHIHSQFEKILVPGSFDRLNHADEDIKKGGLLVTLKGDTFSYKFLENKHAMVFKTIEVNNQSMDELLRELEKISKSNTKAHVRLLNKNEKNNLILYVNELNDKYPNLKITVTNKDTDTQYKDELVKLKKYDRRTAKLDSNTIEHLIKDKLNKMDIEDELKSLVHQEFKKLLDVINE